MASRDNDWILVALLALLAWFLLRPTARPWGRIPRSTDDGALEDLRGGGPGPMELPVGGGGPDTFGTPEDPVGPGDGFTFATRGGGPTAFNPDEISPTLGAPALTVAPRAPPRVGGRGRGGVVERGPDELPLPRSSLSSSAVTSGGLELPAPSTGVLYVSPVAPAGVAPRGSGAWGDRPLAEAGYVRTNFGLVRRDSVGQLPILPIPAAGPVVQFGRAAAAPVIDAALGLVSRAPRWLSPQAVAAAGGPGRAAAAAANEPVRRAGEAVVRLGEPRVVETLAAGGAVAALADRALDRASPAEDALVRLQGPAAPVPDYRPFVHQAPAASLPAPFVSVEAFEAANPPVQGPQLPTGASSLPIPTTPSAANAPPPSMPVERPAAPRGVLRSEMT